MRAYIRLMDTIARACGAVAMLLLASAVVVVCHMIFVRYLLGHSTIWQTEFTIYALMAATFIGSPYVLMLRGHVGVDLLPMALTGAARLVVQLVAALLGLAFCALLAYAGWVFFHEAWAGGWRTDTVWAPPLWIPVAPLPFGAALLCLQYVAEIMKLSGDRS